VRRFRCRNPAEIYRQAPVVKPKYDCFMVKLIKLSSHRRLADVSHFQLSSEFFCD